MKIYIDKDPSVGGYRIDGVLRNNEVRDSIAQNVIKYVEHRIAEEITKKIMENIEPKLEGLFNVSEEHHGNASSSDNVRPDENTN